MVYHVILSFIDKAQFVYPTFTDSKKGIQKNTSQISIDTEKKEVFLWYIM